ncbi:hypothetical protein KAI46_14260 [bacterium]|nr:hypothetical protein [bacterium]
MNRKDIKNEVITQLKKEITKKVLKEIIDEYDFKQDITTPTEEFMYCVSQQFVVRILLRYALRLRLDVKNKIVRGLVSPDNLQHHCSTLIFCNYRIVKFDDLGHPKWNHFMQKEKDYAGKPN